MSQVAPSMYREAVRATPRKRLTPKQKVELLERQDDRCGNCGANLIWDIVEGRKVYGPMIDEHVERLFVGGSNDLANRQMWCTPCARVKTSAEATENAKIRRILKQEDAEQREPSRIRSAGFDQSKTRGFDGQVRPSKSALRAGQ